MYSRNIKGVRFGNRSCVSGTFFLCFIRCFCAHRAPLNVMCCDFFFFFFEVDELNRLASGANMTTALAIFLRHYFLDLSGRYLCFTSHWPLTFDAKDSLGSTSEKTSPRSVIVLGVALSTDLELYRSILPCHINPSRIAFHSGVVGLIYSVLALGFDPIPRFNDWLNDHKEQKWATDLSSADSSLMQCFMDEFFTGNAKHQIMREFDRCVLRQPNG